MMLDGRFLKPRYDAGGFAGIPERIRGAFSQGAYDAVVLFFVDGLGWRFLEKFQNAAFLTRLRREGKLEKLTAQFPSTTASHVTTIHTGLPVGESGVFEWFYYEPLADRIIAPLLFSFAGDKERDTLRSAGLDARRLYPTRTLYQALREMGVESFIFGAREYTPSTYSNVIMHGARLMGFKTLPEALVNMGRLLRNQKKPTYIHLYFDRIDSLCHEYGPESLQAAAEIEVFLLVMEQFFDEIFGSGKRVLFLMTADHGAMQVDPKTTVFLNSDPHFSGFARFLKTNRRGDLLVPAGSPRDMFLYIRDEFLDEAQAFLAERLAGRASVAKTADLMAEGWFGSVISDEFRGRLGNLVILPYQRESVWWFVKDKFEQNYYGHHGGLSPEEMEIPLFTLEVKP